MKQSAETNLFKEYIHTIGYKPIWKRIYASDADGDSPSMRGGHQMCIDVDYQQVYLMGGWDGTKDLSDFWMFDETTQLWTLLSNDTEKYFLFLI